MSVKAMGAVWDLELPHPKQAVLLAYADHADHGDLVNGSVQFGSIKPATARIAWKTGYSVRQVRRITAELLEDGLLVLVRRGGYSNVPNEYAFCPAAGTPKLSYSQWRDEQRLAAEVDDVDAAASDAEESPPRGDNLTPPRSDIAVSSLRAAREDKVSPQNGHSYVHPRSDIAVSPKPSVKPSERGSARRAGAEPPVRDPVFDAIARACGWSEELIRRNRPYATRVGMATATIRDGRTDAQALAGLQRVIRYWTDKDWRSKTSTIRPEYIVELWGTANPEALPPGPALVTTTEDRQQQIDILVARKNMTADPAERRTIQQEINRLRTRPRAGDRSGGS